MMAFTTHCCKSCRLDSARCLLAGWLLLCFGLAWGQVPPSRLKIERAADGVLLTAQLRLELPPSIQEALQKGIPMVFSMRADIARERWYWLSKTVAAARKNYRLSFHPLTQRWRLGLVSGEVSDTELGLTLNQSYDTLDDAWSTMLRVNRWRIADEAAVADAAKYRVDFSFLLDTTQLPRPLQLGNLVLSEWSLSYQESQPLPAEVSP
jgi:hypothetical protein